MDELFKKPKRRSLPRKILGRFLYSLRRHLHWTLHPLRYRNEHSKTPFPFLIFTHRTPLIRNLKNVDMWLQENKIQNLQRAIAELDGLLIKPHRRFSYWKTIGNPSKRNGYLPGLVLDNGTFRPGIGGGLCQL